jgi:phosphoglycolate phosphatase
MIPQMVIFDLDGTLVDSAPEIAGAMERAWEAVLPGRAFPRERLRIGPNLHDTVAELAPSLGSAERDAVTAAFRQGYDASDFSRTIPYPGIAEVLEALGSRGVRCCVATNKRRTPTLAIVERWFPGKFQRIACSDGVWPDDGTVPRTKTAMVAWLAAVAGGGAGAVLVGDMASDVQAARAAGVRCVAVTWGYEDAGALAAAAPDALVRRQDALFSALVTA